MRRVFIMDPQLNGCGGHYLNHDTQLIRELKRMGIPVALYGRKSARVACDDVPAQSLFTHDIFIEATTDNQVWAIENFHSVNELFFADLAGLPAEAFNREDVLYFPNLLQNQMYSLARWVGRLPEERRPAIVVMLRYLNHAMDYVQSRANKELIALYYRFAAQRLVAGQPRSLICADTRELARAYQQITGLPVLELPNPMDASQLLLVRSEGPVPISNGTFRPLVVYQGHTSPLRGFHFLPEIVERCRHLNPKPRFLIQLQNEDQLKSMGLVDFATKLKRMSPDDVELIYGPLEADAYYEMLARADVVLLPYSPTFYGYGSSGVFTEAASAGKVLVVSPQTVPARQGSEYNLGVAVAAEWSPRAMGDRLVEALGQLPALKLKAAAGALAYSRDQCARVLWERVFAALPS